MQIAALRKEHAVLVAKRQELEAEYRRFTIDDFGMEEEHVVAKIERARSVPQKNRRLQAIHEAHVAVVSNEAAIKEAESAVENKIKKQNADIRSTGMKEEAAFAQVTAADPHVGAPKAKRLQSIHGAYITATTKEVVMTRAEDSEAYRLRQVIHLFPTSHISFLEHPQFSAPIWLTLIY